MDSIIVFCAKYLVFLVILLTVWLWLKASDTDRRKIVAQVVLAGVIALALSRLADKLYFHPRPFVDGHVKPLFPHGTDNGFPSDHTVLAMTLTTVIYYYDRQLAGAALILTLLVGTARVLAHVHSPIDILGGILIGIAAGAASWWLVKKYWPKSKDKS